MIQSQSNRDFVKRIEIKASCWLVDQSGYALLALADVLFILKLVNKHKKCHGRWNRTGAYDDALRGTKRFVIPIWK